MNDPLTKSLPLWLRLSLISIILLGCWWRFETYAQREWNVDERNQYYTGQGPFKPFWTPCFYGESHSFPGDYLLTYPFVNISKGVDNKWAAALPHALTTILGFYVLWLLCQRYFKHPAAWIIAFSVFALHRELVYHALELRPYGPLTTLGLSTFYILDSLINPSLSPSRLKCILWWIALLLTILYHPFGMFMIFFYGLFLLLRDFRKTGFVALIQRRWIFWLSLMLVGLPLWLYYLHGNHQNAVQFINPQRTEVFEYIADPLINPVSFFKSIVGNLMGSKAAYLLSLGILVSLFWPKGKRQERWGFIVIVIASPLLLYLISDLTFQYWFIQRQFIWVMAITAFFTGLCWDGILNAEVFHKDKKLCP